MGDFNDIFFKEERIGKRVKYTAAMDFIDCVGACMLEDVKYSDNYYTWNNKRQGNEGIRSKIDWVLANQNMLDNFSSAKVIFSAEELFDHTPAIISLSHEILAFSNIQNATDEAKKELLETQLKLQSDHLNTELIATEAVVRIKYGQLLKGLNSFLHQKSKISWIKNRDENTAIFHASIKERRRSNSILSIEDQQGVRTDKAEEILAAFLSFYQHLLGSKMEGRTKVNKGVMNLGPIVNKDQAKFLLKEYSKDDVKKAIFAIPGIKAPSPDGYSSCFLQEDWDLIGEDISEAVLSFLHTRQILKEINTIVLKLIPKCKCPNTVSYFRPIACCNVIYKTATKLLCSRLKTILPDLIAQNQGGFFSGRFIAHNIMICQDLKRHYGRKNSKVGCMIKLDLQKAYNTLDLDYLEEILHAFQFPDKFIKLIMICVRTPRDSLMFNGSLHGYFKGKWGLRQGDLCSLF
ncbi:uncharacterized protein LOC133036879 [Cannabis sativa]|uniref:uncharacterized protein LOC133036879 n=1 Tax=Cannabis sativa TaxID=3483 RepID=UPI0029C9F8BD|nr:uncharacterized protein LOC133036879 [Cannabis sativa]